MADYYNCPAENMTQAGVHGFEWGGASYAHPNFRIHYVSFD